MYGLVNRGIKCMAIQAGGPECWEAIRKKAGFSDPTFLSMQAYPDEITYSLVAAASEELDTPVEDLLKAFGRHWILFTAQEGYGALLDMTGATLSSFLANLNEMHARVASSMPELTPPGFEVQELDGGVIEVHYFSERAGLAPMVVGLLEGLVERFNTDAFVVQTQSCSDAEHDVFEIRPV